MSSFWVLAQGLPASFLSLATSNRSSAASRRTRLCTGLHSSEVWVLMSALLMRPLESGSTFAMIPTDQLFHDLFSSLITTTLLISMFCFGWFHLGRCCSVGRYSLFHRDQNRLHRHWALRQLRRMKTSLHWNWPGGGRKTLVFVVRIWLGDNGRVSLTSQEITVSGLELTMDLTSHVKVCKDSSSKWPVYSRRRVVRILCTVLISLSQTPPMWLAPGGLNFQSICHWQSLSVISSWFISLIATCSSLSAPTKLLLLSKLSKLWDWINWIITVSGVSNSWTVRAVPCLLSLIGSSLKGTLAVGTSWR